MSTKSVLETTILTKPFTYIVMLVYAYMAQGFEWCCRSYFGIYRSQCLLYTNYTALVGVQYL